VCDEGSIIIVEEGGFTFTINRNPRTTSSPWRIVQRGRRKTFPNPTVYTKKVRLFFGFGSEFHIV